ncbi:MAG: branched-chain amino acid ABC transporter permease [Athalassotoga sp.]|uniref:branched-chain amino acid ABC transporter permease n=1 Tax=Athalassotoga sp. TaxID=2022597 RepID=UPI003D00978F
MKKHLWFIPFVLVPLPFLGYPFLLSIFVLIGIYTIAAIGMDVLTTWAGQISIGNAAFFAVGAYTSAILVVNFHVPFLIAFLISGLFAMIIGIVVGLPALRVSGFYLAVVTMAFGIAVQQVIGVFQITGGYNGIRNIPVPSFWIFKASNPVYQYYVVLTIIFLIFIVLSRISFSKSGLALFAMRDSEIAARAFGVNLLKYKLAAFAASAALTGLAGSLYASAIGFISPSQFDLTLSLDLLAMVIVGGAGSVMGVMIGAAFFVGLPFLLSGYNISITIIQGVALIVILLFLPKGLLQIFKIRDLFKKKVI